MSDQREGGNQSAHARAMAEQAADDLRGTAGSIPGLGDEHERLFDQSPAYTARLDELVFECAICGWWCGSDELSDTSGGDMICEDCADE